MIVRSTGYFEATVVKELTVVLYWLGQTDADYGSHSGAPWCGQKIQTSQKWHEQGDAQMSGFDTHCNNNCGRFCQSGTFKRCGARYSMECSDFPLAPIPYPYYKIPFE